MSSITNVASAFKDFFTKTASIISIQTGFIKRKRKITGESFIKALVVGNIGDSSCSIERMCQLYSEDSIDITKQGLDFRFTENAVVFMKAMFTECMSLFQDNLQLDCDILRQFSSVKLLDSSQVGLPNNMKAPYKGCGASYKGRNCNSKSSVKLQVVFDYLSQAPNSIDLTEGIRSDQGYREHLKDIKENDLFIADLGYFVPAALKQISDLGAYFISRYKSDTNVYDVKSGTKLDLLEMLEHQSFVVRDVFLGKQTQPPVRIICHQLTDEQSTARKRKANLLAKGHGYTSSSRNQRLLDWSIFITNIPASKISSSHIWTIYRTRWQIELLFKLYKSHIKIEALKGRSNSSRVLCELYAKLCIALIFHGLSSLVKSKPDREISPTKALILLQQRARELFLVLSQAAKNIQGFIKKLISDWQEFCQKDRYRKTRMSSLNMLQLLEVGA